MAGGVRTLDQCRTARLHLTRLRTTDLDDLARLHADSQVMATLGGLRSIAETAHFLAEQLAHWEEHGFGLWVARDPVTGRFAGRGGLRHVIVGDRPEVEVAYALMPECWGRGLATELARESVRIGFTALRRPDLVCFTQPTNHASRRVMEKAGFRHEREVTHAGLPHVVYRQTVAGWQAGGGS